MTQDDLILREVMRLIEDDNTDILVDYLKNCIRLILLIFLGFT